MSSILKGLQLNEVNPHNYDSDWDYQDAVAKSGRSRSSYRSQEDDTFDDDVAYSRKMYQLGQQQKAAREKAQRDSDHDRLATGTNEDTGLDIDRSIPGRTIARVSDRANKMSPQASKLPSYADREDEYDQWSGKVGASIHDDEEDTFDTDYTGDEDGELNEISNEKLGRYKTAAAADAGKADLAGDYKKADKRFSGIVKATKKQFANDAKQPVKEDINVVYKEAKSLLKQLDENMQQKVINTLKKNVDDETGSFKTGYPRLSNPKILGTNNKAKSIYYPPSKPNVKKLDKPLPESLGDQLKSKSIEALQQVKQKIEQQRMADLEQWEKDFKQNTVAKFTARQPSFMQQQPKQVSRPLEKHSVLKARLAQLDKAIEKQAVLDKMLQRLDAKGLLTPAIQSDTDTSMLVRDGANDNYVSLNQKLDKALEFVKNRLMTNKAAYAKPKAIDEDNMAPGRMRMNDYYDLADAIQEKLRQAIQMGNKELVQKLAKERDELDAHVKKYGMMPEGVEELDENLHKWFKEKWVRFGPDGKIRGDCARGDDSEGKPKCLPQSKAHSLGKKGRASAASRKRREDPNPERSGKAINVNTKKKSNESVVIGRDEGNFAGNTPVNLGGVAVKNLGIGDIVSYLGQKAKIVAMSKTGNTSRIHIPSGMGGVTKDVLTKDLKRTSLSEEELDEACWKGYHKEGNKKMFGKTYPNCVKNEGVVEGFGETRNIASEIKNIFTQLKNIPGFIEEYKKISANKELIRQLVSKILKSDRSTESIKKILLGNNYALDEGTSFVEKVISFVSSIILLISHYSLIALPLGLPVGNPGGIASLPKFTDRLDAIWPMMIGATIVLALLNLIEEKNKEKRDRGIDEEHHSESCPHCGGEMVSEELMNEKKDACYYKVKSRYKVWPSAYASGALVKCRKKGASNWGNGGKSNESVEEGVAEDQLDEKWTKKYKDSINCSNPKGFSQKAHCAGKKKNESSIMQGLNQLDEGWKEKLGAAALAGSMALGAGAAHSRVTPDGQGGFTGGLKPSATVTAPSDKPAAEAPKGFSKEYLQKAADPNRTGRYMISVEKAQELLKSMP